MALEEYERKRRLDATPEPAGGTRQRGARPLFVVQLHHASHRHYDFRLQVGDTLKSWAVPKGPSLDPAVKRMAVEVEDHPLDYAGFEGDIPKGHYGGGHVAVFDRGTWSTDGDAAAQLAKGHLRFALHGGKLKGGWHLVRTAKPARQPQWLLFKEDDAWAGPTEADDLLHDVTPAPAADAARARRPAGRRKPSVGNAPSRAARATTGAWKARARALAGARIGRIPATPPSPQLARLVDAPPRGEGWLHELKWDGYRLLAIVRGGEVTLWSRNGLDWTRRVPEVRDAVAALDLRDAVLDGELVAGRGTREDFTRLQQVLSGERQGQLRYMVFDLLHLAGIDLTGVALVERKALLAGLLDDAPAHLAYSAHAVGDAAAAFATATAAGFEGLVSKRADASSHPGRSDDWRKSKAQASAEFAVVGFTPPNGSRRGIGALLLATPDPRHGWRYVGRVGSGFSDAQLQALGEQLAGHGGSTPTPGLHVPAHDTDLRQARWLPRPAFVVEVFTRGHGGRGLLRQASFKALRPDKDVAALQDRDTATPAEEKPMAPTATARKRGARRVPPPLTSPDKLLFPDDGLRKQDLADYYTAVMPWLLPELQGRPLSLVRCPGGIAAQCFFQKHATPGLALVSQVPIEEGDGGVEDYLVVRDAASVMELVQFNTIEFHPWGARADDVEACDRLVFDLDPDPAVGWADVVAAARQLRDFLRQAGLESFVRTSGGKGLHLVVPLRPAVPWERARAFAQAVAEAAREADPLRYVATASKALRKGKIFIDWLRNGRGATSVASFSARARPGATVAMPLRWEELGRVKGGHAYDIRNAPARARRWKRHPWAGFERLRQTLPD